MRLTSLLALVLLVLTGCQAPSGAPDSATLDVVVTAQGVSPNGQQVEVRRGGEVIVTLTSHEQTTLHVHGYEIEVTTTPGRTVTRTFVADKLGSFELETHDPAVIVGQLVVRS